jgi:hypothetical protein
MLNCSEDADPVVWGVSTIVYHFMIMRTTKYPKNGTGTAFRVPNKPNTLCSFVGNAISFTSLSFVWARSHTASQMRLCALSLANRNCRRCSVETTDE